MYLHTCRSCGSYIEQSDSAVRTGYRHWMHVACMSEAYIARLRKQVGILRRKASSTEFNQVSRRLIQKAERIEAIISAKPTSNQ